jgi:hypothetical protein
MINRRMETIRPTAFQLEAGLKPGLQTFVGKISQNHPVTLVWVLWVNDLHAYLAP